MKRNYLIAIGCLYVGCNSASPANMNDSGGTDLAVVDDSSSDSMVSDTIQQDAVDVVIDVVQPPPPEVTLTEGTIRGRRSTGYLEFLGIPYAAPPVGALRWRRPAPVVPWTGVRDATMSGSRCPQTLLGSGVSGNEDCLYLNVHTPDPMPANAPVMVWIHGGGFVFGEGIQVDRGTRGDILAAQTGSVVVSMNYRLGQLGFLAHPALSSEDNGHSGNYGLYDQLAALTWVRDHIQLFGGNPNNVTIFGESAGGMSVCAHLTSPLTSGLFQKAIIQSGPCGLPMTALTTAHTDGDRFATMAGCTDPNTVAQCMRNLPFSTVVTTLPPAPAFISNDPMYGDWGPIVDGVFLTEPEYTSFSSGNFHRVPTIFGWNRDEGTLFVYLAEQHHITNAEYPAAISSMMRNDSNLSMQVLAQYPLSAYPTAYAAYAAALGDLALKCPARRTWRAMTQHLTETRAYEFVYANAGFQFAVDVPLGAFHSGEIQFIFGHPAMLGRSRFLGPEEQLRQTMSGYWTRFAATSDPNGASAVQWPLYTRTLDNFLQIDATQQQVQTGVASQACEFWENLGVYNP